MTGFGSVEGKVGQGRLYIEIKSINHRYREINFRMPGKMTSLEHLIRSVIQTKIARGKCDIYIRENEKICKSTQLTVNVALAKQFNDCLTQLEKSLALPKTNNPIQFMDLNKIISVEEVHIDYEKWWKQIETLVNRALTQLTRMRQKEGINIRKDQKLRLKHLLRLVKQIDKTIKKAQSNQPKKLREKINASVGEGVFDEQRFQNEVVFMISKQDISEEIVRLYSHIKQYAALIDDKGLVGRKIDFLLQEMNREINTIGSKSSGVAISEYVVEAKSELERLREQIQNIE